MNMKFITVREAAELLRVSSKPYNDTWLKEGYHTLSQPDEY